MLSPGTVSLAHLWLAESPQRRLIVSDILPLQVTIEVRPNPGPSKSNRFMAQALPLEDLLRYNEDDTKESVFEVPKMKVGDTISAETRSPLMKGMTGHLETTV